MEGYIKNKTNVWRHALKRSIGPGHKVSLDELYEQYGKKHDLSEGVEFVEWLKNVKLPDRNVWEIVYGEDKSEDKPDDTDKNIAEMTSPFVKKELEVDDIVNMPVRKAREEIKKITDINLLKLSFSQANQLAHKETLCRLLRKRIQELELIRR